MGQAKRRSDKGSMPEQTTRPVKKAKFKTDPWSFGSGMSDIASLIASFSLTSMYGRNSGRNFAIRSEIARMNRENAGVE